MSEHYAAKRWWRGEDVTWQDLIDERMSLILEEKSKWSVMGGSLDPSLTGLRPEQLVTSRT